MSPPLYLFVGIDHELDNPLDPLKFRTHVLAGAHGGDGIGKDCRFVGVRKKAIFDSFFPLAFAAIFEL